jgi:hypothetical protein
MEYKAVESGTPEWLEEQVNELLADGWQLHGITMLASTPVGDGSVINNFVQAMRRESKRS